MALELVVSEESDGINSEYLEEFIAYRKEDLKKPLTPRGIKMLKKKLSAWSEVDQIRLIEHAMECTWKTVFWTDPPKQHTSKSTSIESDLTDRSWAN
jgi:hypothetical protein